MGQKFVDEQEEKSLESMYNDAVYMAVDGKDIEWSIECALKATGALDYEPYGRIFYESKALRKRNFKN